MTRPALPVPLLNERVTGKFLDLDPDDRDRPGRVTARTFRARVAPAKRVANDAADGLTMAQPLPGPVLGVDHAVPSCVLPPLADVVNQ